MPLDASEALLGVAGKVALSASLLWWVMRSVDLESVRVTLQGISVSAVAFALR